MRYDNFTWLVEDICSTLILRVTRRNGSDKESFYGIFDVFKILNATGEKLVVNNANIDDLTKFLTMGIVRFTNLKDPEDIIDVPIRNLYKLYDNSNKIMLNSGNYEVNNKRLKVSSLEGFAIIDGTPRVEDFDILACSIGGNLSEDLKEVLELAKNFNSLGMQEKMDALGRLNVLIYRKNRYLA